MIVNYVELIQLQAEQVFAGKEKAAAWLTVLTLHLNAQRR
jgi:hypothetical protein